MMALINLKLRGVPGPRPFWYSFLATNCAGAEVHNLAADISLLVSVDKYIIWLNVSMPNPCTKIGTRNKDSDSPGQKKARTTAVQQGKSFHNLRTNLEPHFIFDFFLQQEVA